MSGEKKDIAEIFDGWDNGISETDFFSESKEATEPAESVEKKEEEEVAEEPVEAKEETTVEAEEKPAEEGGEQQDQVIPSKGTALEALRYLKGKGMADFKDSEDLTEDEAEEILERSMEDGIDNRIEEMFSGLPAILKNLTKYALDGGDVREFIHEVIAKQPSHLSPDLDLTNPANQELVIRTQLASEGYDDEYIDSQIEFLNTNGKLENAAQNHFNKWKKAQEEQQQLMMKQQREAARSEQEGRRKLKARMADFVNSLDDIQGVKITTQDRREIPSYMSDRNITLDDGTIVTALQRDLRTVLQDDEKAVLLAKMLKGGFDLNALQRVVKSHVVSEERQNVRRVSSKPPQSAGTAEGQRKKALWDYFS